MKTIEPTNQVESDVQRFITIAKNSFITTLETYDPKKVSKKLYNGGVVLTILNQEFVITFNDFVNLEVIYEIVKSDKGLMGLLGNLTPTDSMFKLYAEMSS